MQRVFTEICKKVCLRSLYSCGSRLTISDLLLRHRQKIHDREKRSRQNRRPRSQSTVSTSTAAPLQALAKVDAPPLPKRRRVSISVTHLPPQNPSSSSASQPTPPAVYMPTSAPATTTSFFNFNYPSPSSTSPSSTGADFMDCSINTNYVNPADLYNAGSFSASQSFTTPASTVSNSSVIAPTPRFHAYMSSFTSPSKSDNSMHRASVDSSVFDISTMMNTLSDQNTQSTTQADENSMMMDNGEISFSPKLFDMTPPASFSNDSGFPNIHSNSPFQFAWQSTSHSHDSDDYNTSLPFEPSASFATPMDIILKQDTKLNSTYAFTPTLNCSAQLFPTFPENNDVFDLLIDDKEASSYTCAEIVDSILRANLIATVQSAGVSVPEIPVAMDLSIYVSAYWEYIHPHAPIFFKPGFVAHFVQEGILLGMCALGALAMGALQHANALNICTKAVVKEVRLFSKFLILATK